VGLGASVIQDRSTSSRHAYQNCDRGLSLSWLPKDFPESLSDAFQYVSLCYGGHREFVFPRE
jgi:hypothetical protein